MWVVSPPGRGRTHAWGPWRGQRKARRSEVWHGFTAHAGTRPAKVKSRAWVPAIAGHVRKHACARASHVSVRARAVRISEWRHAIFHKRVQWDEPKGITSAGCRVWIRSCESVDLTECQR